MRGSVDHDDQDMILGATRDLSDSCGAGHQWIPISYHRQGWNSQAEQPFQRRILGERAEHSRVLGTPKRNSRQGHRHHSDRFPGAIRGELSHRPSQRLIVTPPAGETRIARSRNGQDSGGRTPDDGAAHRIADQGCRMDLAVVEERGRRMRQLGHVERFSRLATARNPGRSGTRVWKSLRRSSAVGRRWRPERPNPCTCIITGASGGAGDSR